MIRAFNQNLRKAVESYGLTIDLVIYYGNYKEAARLQLTFILRPPIIIKCFVLKYIRLYYISNDDAQLAIVESLGRYEESI